uniref:Uncharacterized protein n=1 Tax=Lactuca sativa TaxID=4236 RepID=A0A9R1WY50_LACSA|nr:hypothetical protein LSAT_V11C800411620 [Lactuca sativa]
MASSSKRSTTIASSWQNPHGDFRNKNNPMVLYQCGVEASFLVSWTDKNLGRSFRGCPNYKLELANHDQNRRLMLMMKLVLNLGHVIYSDVGNWDCSAGEGLGS